MYNWQFILKNYLLPDINIEFFTGNLEKKDMEDDHNDDEHMEKILSATCQEFDTFLIALLVEV